MKFFKMRFEKAYVGLMEQAWLFDRPGNAGIMDGKQGGLSNDGGGVSGYKSGTGNYGDDERVPHGIGRGRGCFDRIPIGKGYGNLRDEKAPFGIGKKGTANYTEQTCLIPKIPGSRMPIPIGKGAGQSLYQEEVCLKDGDPGA